MKVQVRILIASQLSDVQELGLYANQKMLDTSMNYCKWLLAKYPNTETEVDANEEYELFNKETR